MKLKDWLVLLVFVIAAQSAGLLGGFFTARSLSSWYVYLGKPFFNPPSWLFGPVWICLYALIGISAFLVWKTKTKKKKIDRVVWVVFAAQLLVNALWSILFFGLRSPGLAYVDIVILLGLIIANISVFGKINKTAARLLYPYLAWVAFAAFLNFSIWYLNA